MSKEISQEKLDWMEKVGMKEFEEPMKYRLGTNFVYSEKYIKETPLEVLKAKYNKKLILLKAKDKLEYNTFNFANIVKNFFKTFFKAVFHKDNASRS